LVAILFLTRLIPHYRSKPQARYLLWWTIGVATYGLGTLAESINTVFGWSELNTRLWYIVGALLGGWPLAQGTVYLLMRRKVADVLTVIFLVVIAVAATCVMLTPVDVGADFDGRLTGRVFVWEWVRWFSPFINLYAFIFLFGGAIYSALRYAKLGRDHPRFLGNVFISIGALLPGIGGSFTRAGYVEVLFVTELIGLLCIYYGYTVIRRDRQVSVYPAQAV
ncbi:MAG: hypothetical protein R3301_16770, partial [Saprospiraceae bacterium]|nr:hypothetical protein [Saprospiraceae bacterium]